MPKLFFFCNDRQVEAISEAMTGAQIKAEAKKVDDTINLQHDLVLQASGQGEDQQIRDDTIVNLTHGHGEGPKHFFTRPPTNFGRK